MPKASEARIFRALLRRDFPTFVRKVFATLESGQAYVPNWHLEAIAYQLERVRRGEIKRLIINMPPRSLKSVTASVAFPAFVLGHNPARRIICVSYSGDLARIRQKNSEAEIRTSKTIRPSSPPPCSKDALLDLTNRGDLVIDPFLGSGSTLIAAEATGRVCHGVELDPLYVDVIARRYEAATGNQAVLVETEETFQALGRS